jgi:putative flippase GtrA
LLFAGLIELAGAAPLLANFAAFCVAVGVSFFGHFHWTFAGEHLRPGGNTRVNRTFARFFAVAVFGLGLNSLAVYVITDVLMMSYLYSAGLMVTVVPVILFVINKYWAFAAPRRV